MPPPKQIHHVQQIAEGYCLAACAQMALEQFGISVSQKQVSTTLTIKPGIGAPFSNVQSLTRFGIDVQLASQRGIRFLQASLNSPQTTAIAAILTSPGLPGWGELVTQHAILISNIDQGYVFYHDPAHAAGPTQASIDEFLLVWAEMDEMVAILRSK